MESASLCGTRSQSHDWRRPVKVEAASSGYIERPTRKEGSVKPSGFSGETRIRRLSCLPNPFRSRFVSDFLCHQPCASRDCRRYFRREICRHLRGCAAAHKTPPRLATGKIRGMATGQQSHCQLRRRAGACLSGNEQRESRSFRQPHGILPELCFARHFPNPPRNVVRHTTAMNPGIRQWSPGQPTGG